MSIKVLRIAYNHYFCNMAVISDEDLLNIHYIVTEKLNNDEDIENWEDLHKDLLIWAPFVNTMPSDIMDNIEDLISDIEMNLLPDPNVYITLNLVEVAAELAHEATANWFDRLDRICQEEDVHGDLYYTAEAQDYFNTEYDYYTDWLRSKI